MINFDHLCLDHQVTQPERESLVHHLAGIRYRETLKLAVHPIARPSLPPHMQGPFPEIERCEHGIPKTHACQKCGL